MTPSGRHHLFTFIGLLMFAYSLNGIVYIGTTPGDQMIIALLSYAGLGIGLTTTIRNVVHQMTDRAIAKAERNARAR
jgi:uncharacterized membrane protein YczE